MSRTDSIAKRFAEWSDGGTLPSPQHAKDVAWLLSEHERMDGLIRAYLEVINQRDEAIRRLQGEVDSLTRLVMQDPR